MKTEFLHGVRVYSGYQESGHAALCLCHDKIWHQCDNYNRKRKHTGVLAKSTVTPKDVLVEDNNVCSCHDEYWRKCPNIISQGHTSIKIADKAEIELVNDTRNDEVIVAEPRTLAKINADIKKTQNRLDLNDSKDRRWFGTTILLLGLGVGLAAVPAFILLPWLCGVALIVVSILSVWGGGQCISDPNQLMKIERIAELQDKLIDLDAEYQDKIQENWNELKGIEEK